MADSEKPTMCLTYTGHDEEIKIGYPAGEFDRIKEGKARFIVPIEELTKIMKMVKEDGRDWKKITITTMEKIAEEKLFIEHAQDLKKDLKDIINDLINKHKRKKSEK